MTDSPRDAAQGLIASTTQVLRALDLIVEQPRTGVDGASMDLHLADDDVGWEIVLQLVEALEHGASVAGLQAARQVFGPRTTPTFTHQHRAGASVTYYGPEFDHTTAAPGSREWRVLQAIADAERQKGTNPA